jgi:predicted RNA-binding protein YlqC (UPF0109 family)
MDEKWGSGFRDGRKPFKKGGFGLRRSGPSRPISDHTYAEDVAQYIIKVLARDEETLKIVEDTPELGRVHMIVTCDPALTGRIIGKGGKTITALRELTRAIASRLGKRVDIEVSS